MRVIAKRTLREFWDSRKFNDAKRSLEAWHEEAIKAKWSSPQDVKNQFRNVSILKNNRLIFNISSNKYRLVVADDYKRQVLFIRFIGTHTQYDQINAETI